jgi:hypothetical protein
MAYALGAVKPWVRAAAEEIGPKFGVTTIFGWAPGRYDHPKGLALDFMVYRNKARGDAIASYTHANASRLAVTYIIWYRKVWSTDRAGEGWRPYSGTSNPHTDHVHVSFTATGTGATGAPASETGLPGSDLDNIVKAAEWLTNSQNWVRIGLFVAGSMLLLIGTLRLISSSAGLAAIPKTASKIKKVVKSS